jgi:hypothetical protein
MIPSFIGDRLFLQGHPIKTTGKTVEALGMNRLRLSARPLTFLTEILQMEPMIELSARLRLPLLAANGKRQHRRGLPMRF